MSPEEGKKYVAARDAARGVKECPACGSHRHTSHPAVIVPIDTDEVVQLSAEVVRLKNQLAEVTAREEGARRDMAKAVEANQQLAEANEVLALKVAELEALAARSHED